MTSYATYLEQISHLQSLAEAARKQEIKDAIKQINELMSQHGLSVKDFAADSRAKPMKAKATVVAQFRNPETGDTWSGRGRAPRWLDGKDKAQFRIKN